MIIRPCLQCREVRASVQERAAARDGPRGLGLQTWGISLAKSSWSLKPGDAASAAGHTAAAHGAPGFLLLYGALFCAYGTESAYMPAFLLSHGLPVERIGLVLAAGMVVRIASGAAIGRLADRLRRRKQVLTVAAGTVGLGRLGLHGRLRLPALARGQHGSRRRNGLPRPALRRPCGRGRLGGSRLSIRMGQRRRLGGLRVRNLAVGPTGRSIWAVLHHRDEQRSFPCHGALRGAGQRPAGGHRPLGRGCGAHSGRFGPYRPIDGWFSSPSW